MNSALVNELEQDEKPASMIAAKNRTCEFFIQKAKLKNLNAITCMGSLGLNSQNRSLLTTSLISITSLTKKPKKNLSLAFYLFLAYHF